MLVSNVQQPPGVVLQSMTDLAPFKEKKTRTQERKKGASNLWRGRIEQTTNYGYVSQASSTAKKVQAASAAALVEALHLQKQKQRQPELPTTELARKTSDLQPQQSLEALPSELARVNSDMIDDYIVRQDIKFIEKKNRKVMVTYLANKQKPSSLSRKS